MEEKKEEGVKEEPEKVEEGGVFTPLNIVPSIATKCMICQDVEGDAVCAECLGNPINRELFHLVTYIRNKGYNDNVEMRKRIFNLYYKKVRERIRKRMSEEKVLEELSRIKSEVVEEVYGA